jgi:hypothetical protein
MHTRQLPYPFLLDTCPPNRKLLHAAEMLYAETAGCVKKFKIFKGIFV